MSATESLAAVDTICVDKTGTLTDGELRLLGVEVADGVDAGRRRTRRWRASPPAPATATAPWRRSPSASPARPGGSAPRSPSPRSGSGAARPRRIGAAPPTCSARPTCSAEAGALTLPPGLARRLERGDRRRAAGRRLRRVRRARCPPTPPSAAPPRLTPLALVVLEETLRPDAAETIAFMREQEVDLKLISGDARATVTAVAYGGRGAARRRRGRGPRPARGPGGAGRGGARATRSSAGSSRSRRRRWSRRCVDAGPLHGDDRRRRQRRAGAEAGADGGGDGLGRAGDQGRRRRRPAQGRVLAPAARRSPRAGGSPATSTASAAST